MLVDKASNFQHNREDDYAGMTSRIFIRGSLYTKFTSISPKNFSFR